MWVKSSMRMLLNLSLSIEMMSHSDSLIKLKICPYFITCTIGPSPTASPGNRVRVIYFKFSSFSSTCSEACPLITINILS